MKGRVSSGLSAVSSVIRATRRTGCLVWTQLNRRIDVSGKWVPFSIYKQPWFYPFLEPIYEAVDEMAEGLIEKIVIKKGTQEGISELLINAEFYFLDQFYENGMYMLPIENQLGDFAHNRLDKTIQNSPYLAAMFSDISNVGLKVTHHGGLYLRGANSRAKLEEVPIGFLVRDELDRMNRDNADLALERMGASENKWLIDVSHPTFPGEGITAEYETSSHHEWFFTCPHCKTKQKLDWFENVDMENGCFRCAECNAVLEKQDLWDGDYKSSDPDNSIRGYHFSQLLSPRIELGEQIAKWKIAQGKPYLMQIFYNSVLGLEYAPSGEKLTKAEVRNQMVGPVMVSGGDKTEMGVDVGAGLHFWIQEGDNVLKLGCVMEWSALDIYVNRFHPACVVIDADPEYHKAREFMDKWRALKVNVWLCDRSSGHDLGDVIDKEAHILKVNMVNQFDEFYASFPNLILPADLPEEAIDHLVAPTRILKETVGGTKGTWEKGVCHYADAGCYALAARKLTKEAGPVIVSIDNSGLTRRSTFKDKFQ